MLAFFRKKKTIEAPSAVIKKVNPVPPAAHKSAFAINIFPRSQIIVSIQQAIACRCFLF